ncbi:MAG: hypothetical protein V1806_02130 [Pseudomonadota bacterium]
MQHYLGQAAGFVKGIPKGSGGLAQDIPPPPGRDASRRGATSPASTRWSAHGQPVGMVDTSG